jgi:hypothetical protein
MHFSSGGSALPITSEAVEGVGGLADFLTHKYVLTLYDTAKSREMRHKKEQFR